MKKATPRIVKRWRDIEHILDSFSGEAAETEMAEVMEAALEMHVQPFVMGSLEEVTLQNRVRDKAERLLLRIDGVDADGADDRLH